MRYKLFYFTATRMIDDRRLKIDYQGQSEASILSQIQLAVLVVSVS